jgi:hypothetical protein
LKNLLLTYIWLFVAPLASVYAQPLKYVSAFEEIAFTQTKDTSAESLLSLLLASDPAMTKDKLAGLQNQLQGFTLRLQQERHKYSSDKKFLRWLVQEIRTQFLHSYDYTLLFSNYLPAALTTVCRALLCMA